MCNTNLRIGSTVFPINIGSNAYVSTVAILDVQAARLLPNEWLLQLVTWYIDHVISAARRIDSNYSCLSLRTLHGARDMCSNCILNIHDRT